MMFTVAICTWNRAASLDATLASFRRLHVPTDIPWELLVVDNNSSDGTPEVIARWAADLPIRSVFEARQGLSHARNRIVQEARGDVVLFTDDDVIVDPNWLAAYADACRRYPRAMFFGGPITALFLGKVPLWLSRNLGTLGDAYGIRSLGDGEETRIVATLAELPYGANMAIRRAAFSELVFETRIGLLGTDRYLGEESRFLEALCQSGHHGVWVGRAAVQHVIPAQHVTKKYIWMYFYWQGRTKIRTILLQDHDRDGLDVHKLAAKSRKKTLALWLSVLRKKDWALNFVDSAKARGMVDELRRFHV